MTETAVATAAAPATAPAEPEAPLSGKEKIYAKIQQWVQDKVGKNIGKTGGNQIFDMVVLEIFQLAVADGSLRLNAGFGSFHMRDYKPGKRRTPSGVIATFGDRKKLRYEQGVSVEAMITGIARQPRKVKPRGKRKKVAAKATTKPAAAKAPAAAVAPPAAAAKPTDGDVSLE